MEKTQKNNVFIRILAILVYVLMIVGLLFNNNNKIVATILSVSMYLLGILSIVFNFYKIRKSQITLREETKRIAKYAADYILFDLIITLAISSVYRLMGITIVSTNQQELEEILKNSLSFYKVLAMILIGPIIEEALFRFLPRTIFKNNILFVLISSTVFAIMHCLGSENIFFVFLLYIPSAVYLGYAYSKTDDLFVSMGMHVTGNLLSTILILISMH